MFYYIYYRLRLAVAINIAREPLLLRFISRFIRTDQLVFNLERGFRDIGILALAPFLGAVVHQYRE